MAENAHPRDPVASCALSRPSACPGRLLRFLLAPLLAALLCVCATLPAHAWKPNTHLYAANQAIKEILLGSNSLTINGIAYPVDARVAQAIRDQTAYYRGGVVGPDGFPDVYVGQAFIHPNTACNNGELFEDATDPSKRCNFDGASFTYEWLRHVYEAGWQYYNERGGDARGEQALAFAYGYLTHAAGDMWGHTFVNDFAKGIFPPWTGGGDINIGVRHFIVEGYVGRHTPHPDNNLNSIEISSPSDTDPNDPHSNFIYWAFIADGYHNGFVDSAGLDSRLLGRGVIFDFFYRLRDDLVVLGGNPELFFIKDCLLDDWVVGIDDGLQSWPAMSQKIAHALFSTVDPVTGEAALDLDSAKQAVSDFMSDKLPAMLGLDNCITDVFEALLDLLQPVIDLLDDIADLVQPLKDFITDVQTSINDCITDMENWLLVQLTGHDMDYYKSLLTSPCTYINTYPGLDSDTAYPALGSVTSDQMDALMGITGGLSVPCDTPTFDADQLDSQTPFRAVRNTIVMSQLVLLNTTDPNTPNQLDKLLDDNRVGPIYRPGAPYADRDNAMLGFIRSIDANQQWRRVATTIDDLVVDNGVTVARKNGEGMPLWLDCLARQRVFRTLFMDWQNGSENFPDMRDGHPETFDPPLNISSTPPPTSGLTINGLSVTTNGNVYIGGAASLTLAAQSTHFWDPSEVTLKGTVTDPNSTVSNLGPTPASITVGPLTGPDGPYVLDFHGECTPCGIAEAPDNLRTIYLDKTPPTISYASPLPIPPSPGLVLDVVNTSTLSYTVTDGGSGVASYSATIDGNSFANGATIDAFFYTAGDHLIVVTAADKLGNSGTANDTFSVHATTAGLLGATTRGYNLGLITIPRSLNAWLVNLQNADNFYQQGKNSQAITQLQAAENLIAHQLGSGIQTDLGNRMIGWIDDLIKRLS